MKNAIDIVIDFEHDGPLVLGQKASGEIIVQVSEHVEVDYIEFRLVREVRGLMRTKTEVINRKVLASSSTLISGEKYVYPFAVINAKHETYKGKNAEVLARVEANVRLPDKKLKDQVVSSFGFTSPGRKQSASQFVEFIRQHHCNEVESSSKELDIQPVLKPDFWIIMAFVLFMMILSADEIPQGVRIGVFGLGVLGALGGIIYFTIGKRLIGTIKAEFDGNEEEGFSVGLSNTMNWQNVKKLEVSYRVMEEVQDDRGTSHATEKHYLYLSNLQTIERPRISVKLNFEYPGAYIPAFTCDIPCNPCTLLNYGSFYGSF